ncbi:MAG: hypothetical protein ACOYMN_14945 [Roseimicrobium sp.]
MELFKDLPEDERQKVRAAFDKAWSQPEVVAARERLGKANEEFRQAMQKAMKQADPEVAKILEKARPPMPPGGGPMISRMPDMSDPDFARKAVMRLAMELQLWARAERRDIPTFRVHERIVQTPAVQEAINRLTQAPTEQREEAWRALRDAYHATLQQELSNGRKEGERMPPNREAPGPPREGSARPRPDAEPKPKQPL